MGFIPKRQMLYTILTQKGKEDYLSGKLSFNFFSLDDQSTDYSYLSSSYSNNIETIESGSVKETILEPFELDCYVSSSNIPKIFDYLENDSYVPLLTSSRSNNITGSVINLDIAVNMYLKNVIDADTTDENIEEQTDILNKLENGDISQADFYTYDSAAIDLDLKTPLNKDMIDQYGVSITCKQIPESGETMDLVIRKNSEYDSSNYSVGEFQGGSFTEYLIIKTPDNIDSDFVPVIPKFTMPGKWGNDRLPLATKRLRDKVVKYADTNRVENAITKSTHLLEFTEEEKEEKHEFGAPDKAV